MERQRHWNDVFSQTAEGDVSWFESLPVTSIRLLEADVAGDWSLKPMDIWHDRAVFHFLTEKHDRDRYRFHLLTTLKEGGSAILATFAPDGPDRCSGLPVVRYSPESLSAELGPALGLVESVPHVHTTPWGATQSFLYCRFRRVS